MGDLNEQLGTDSSLMAQICCNHNMYDVFVVIYTHLYDSPINARGYQRNDYFSASTNIPEPEGVGHNLLHLLYKSDHRSIFLDLPLHPEAPTIIPNALREILSTSDKVTLFITTIHKYLEKNNIYATYTKCIKKSGVYFSTPTMTN